MLYHILTSYISELSALNVFRYITFRSILAVMTALAVSFLLGERLIKFLHKLQGVDGQPIRLDGPVTHLKKKGTPTMGGIMMLIAIIVTTLLWSDLKNPFVWIILSSTLLFGLIGLLDDILKVKHKNVKGVSGKLKLLYQFSISFIVIYFISLNTPDNINNSLAFPFFKAFIINLGIWYFFFAAIVITGASNAVNLTDGLDGLAIGPIIVVAGCFAIICYLTGNSIFSAYLQISFIPGVGELTIFCAAIVGAGLGFLWYNAYPAQIIMGDVGSLALGGALGTLSVIAKHEILLSIIGIIFVLEALSVIIQVFCFKMWRYRPFAMAPLHHHFEKIGWSETKVVVRFWIIAIVFALIGLSTLKLR